MGALLVIYRPYRRAKPKVTRTVLEPPSDLSPAMAGVVTSSGADPRWDNALGTLFNLAEWGALRIEELPEKGLFRQRDFVIERLEEPAVLRAHERGLLEALFETKEGITEEVKLSELSKRMASEQWKRYAEPLKKELEVAGFVTAITGSVISPLTEAGAAEAGAWQRFADYLKQVSKGKAAVSGPEMFRRFLPYAASFGLLQPWAKWFEKEGWTELPPYFRSLARADEGAVAAFVALAAASSSAGGSAAGAAGAGAAGGGASGAG